MEQRLNLNIFYGFSLHCHIYIRLLIVYIDIILGVRVMLSLCIPLYMGLVGLYCYNLVFSVVSVTVLLAFVSLL